MPVMVDSFKSSPFSFTFKQLKAREVKPHDKGNTAVGVCIHGGLRGGRREAVLCEPMTVFVPLKHFHPHFINGETNYMVA